MIFQIVDWNKVFVPNADYHSKKFSDQLQEEYSNKNRWGLIQEISQGRFTIYNVKDAMMYSIRKEGLAKIV